MEEAQGALNMVLSADGRSLVLTRIGAAGSAVSSGFEANEIWDLVCDGSTRSIRVVTV